MILNQLHTFLLSGFLWMQPLHAPPPPSHHGNHAAGKPRRSGPAIIVDGKISRQMPFKDAISCLLSCSSAGNSGMVQLRWRLNALVFFFFAWIKLMELDLLLMTTMYTYIQAYKTWDWNRYLTHFFKVNQVHSIPCILIPVFNIAIAKTWNSFEFSNMETINHA